MRWILLLIISLFTSLSQAESDPKILTPIASIVWQAGNRQKIQWNVTFAEKGTKYYTNFTRVSISLFEAKSKSELARVIDNFPFMLGSIYWTVPSQVTVNGWFGSKKNVTIGNDKSDAYYLMIYPSYFDWSDACPGCKSRAPRGDRFMILPKDCSSVECQNLLPKVDQSGVVIPGAGSKTDYLMAVQFVGIAVGVVALFAFVIAFFIYTKQGKKTWQKYRRKRSGLLYRYKPPVADSGKTPSPLMKPKNETPLGNFFSETDDSTRFRGVIARESSLFMADGVGSTDSQASIDLMEPPRAAATKLPTRPPRPFSNGSSLLAGRSTEAADNSLLSLKSGEGSATSRPDSYTMSIDSPSLRVAEAALVGNAFRNALRVHSDDIEDDETEVHIENDPVVGSYEKDHKRFLNSIPEDVKEEVKTGCSPLLNQLSYIHDD